MDKNLKISILLDFYKKLITHKQADAMDLYYNKDLSLAEIGQHLDITRQGVRDSIKRGEKVLFDLEDQLGLVSKFISIQERVEIINEAIYAIEDINEQKLFSDDVKNNISIIKDAVNDITEKI